MTHGQIRPGQPQLQQGMQVVFFECALSFFSVKFPVHTLYEKNYFSRQQQMSAYRPDIRPSWILQV